jgi:lipoate-protein ligase A
MLMMVADSIILKFGNIAYLYNITDILQKFTKISGTWQGRSKNRIFFDRL